MDTSTKSFGRRIGLVSLMAAIFATNSYAKQTGRRNGTTNPKTIHNKVLGKTCKRIGNSQRKRRKLLRQVPSNTRSKQFSR